MRNEIVARKYLDWVVSDELMADQSEIQKTRYQSTFVGEHLLFFISTMGDVERGLIERLRCNTRNDTGFYFHLLYPVIRSISPAIPPMFSVFYGVDPNHSFRSYNLFGKDCSIRCLAITQQAQDPRSVYMHKLSEGGYNCADAGIENWLKFVTTYHKVYGESPEDYIERMLPSDALRISSDPDGSDEEPVE